MTEVVYKSLKQKKSVARSRKVKAASGQAIVVHTINTKSKKFGEQLSYVFGKNVMTARRLNKKLTGKVD